MKNYDKKNHTRQMYAWDFKTSLRDSRAILCFDTNVIYVIVCHSSIYMIMSSQEMNTL